MKRGILPLVFAFASLYVLFGNVGGEPARAAEAASAAHLTFQLFTDSSPKLWDAPNVFSRLGQDQMNFAVASKQEMASTVREIVGRIGTTGSSSRKLGFTVGPIALEYSDDQIRTLIRDAFEIAQEEQVGVGFHIDDSMFWYRRRELWTDPRNVEWLDWSGTPNTARRIDWNPAGGTRLAPQMCYNARDIVAEVTRIARDVIGAEVRRGIDELERTNQPELFAGVIVGWETQLGRDFDTNRQLGFCALSNRGYSEASPPADMDAEREQIVREFIELWSAGLAAAGIDSRQLYSHTAFLSPTEHADIIARDPSRAQSFSEINNFAPARVAFGRPHNPGFSTYPRPGLDDHLHEELSKRPESGGWASAEGTNVQIGMDSVDATMEAYLARHFNRGATLVNLFGWGVGTQGMPFRRATESGEAIAAYRKFLNGESLAEAPAEAERTVDRWLTVIERTR